MAVAFRAAGTWSFTSNNVATPATLTPGAPAGVQAGDLLVLVCESRSITATVATPTGWALVTGFPKRSATASGGTIYVFTRIADGTATDTPSPVWSGLTTGTSGDASGAGILAWSGASAVLDGTVQVSDLAAQTTSSVIPAFMTATNGSVVIGIAMKLLESSGQTSTVATFTERADNQTTSGTGHTIEVSEKIQATAGSSGTATVTWSATTSARVLAVSLGLQAAPVPITPAGISATSTMGGVVANLNPVVPDVISATSTISGSVTDVAGSAFTLANSFEGGTAGNALTTTSGQGAPDAPDTVSNTSPNTQTYDATPLTTGSLSIKHAISASAANSFWAWSTKITQTLTLFYVRSYWQLSALPSATADLLQGLLTGTLGWQITITSTGQIRLFSGSTSKVTSTTTISANTPFRIEAQIDHANGVTCRIFVGTNVEGTTPDETISFSGALPTASTNVFRSGLQGALTSAINMWEDATVLTTGGWVGPAASGGTKSITPAGISATSTVSGSFIAARPIAPAAISASSSVGGGVGAPRLLVTGVISAASTVTGAIRVTRAIKPTVISATSTVTGTIRVIRRITTAGISATSTVTATVGRVRPIVPTAISATSTVTGAVGRVRRVIPANVAATSTVTGAVVKLARISGVVSATSTVSGVVAVTRRVTGAISATSTVTGRVAAIKLLHPAVVSATSTVTGSIHIQRGIVPTVISAPSTVSGRIVVLHRIGGVVAATSTVSGSIRIGGKISGAAISATSTVSGAISRIRRLTGAISATSTLSGAIGRIRHLAGAISATSSVTGAIGRIRRITGAISATSTLTGRIGVVRVLVGNILASSVVGGAVGRIVYPTGAITATSTVTGTVGLIHPIAGQIMATSSVAGSIVSRPAFAISGNISATSTISGAVRVQYVIYGRTKPRLTATQWDKPQMTSGSLDKPILERVR